MYQQIFKGKSAREQIERAISSQIAQHRHCGETNHHLVLENGKITIEHSYIEHLSASYIARFVNVNLSIASLHWQHIVKRILMVNDESGK